MQPLFHVGDLVHHILTFLGFPAAALYCSVCRLWRSVLLRPPFLRGGVLELGRELVPLADTWRRDIDEKHFDPNHMELREASAYLWWPWKKVPKLKVLSLDVRASHDVTEADLEALRPQIRRDRDVTDTIFFVLSRIECVSELVINLQWPWHVSPETMCAFRAQMSLKTIVLHVEDGSKDWLTYLTRNRSVPLGALKSLTVMHPGCRGSMGDPEWHVPSFGSAPLGDSTVECLDVWHAHVDLAAHHPLSYLHMPHMANLRQLALYYCWVVEEWLQILPALDTLHLFHCGITGHRRARDGDRLLRARKAYLTMRVTSLERVIEHLHASARVELWPTTTEFAQGVWDALLRVRPRHVEIACKGECGHDAVRGTLDAMFGSVPPAAALPLSQLQITVGAGWTTSVPEWGRELLRIANAVPPTIVHLLSVRFKSDGVMEQLAELLLGLGEGWKLGKWWKLDRSSKWYVVVLARVGGGLH